MFDHQDTLEGLNKNLPLGQKLSSVQGVIQKQFNFVDRASVAIYDHKTDMLKTYNDIFPKTRLVNFFIMS